MTVTPSVTGIRCVISIDDESNQQTVTAQVLLRTRHRYLNFLLMTVAAKTNALHNVEERIWIKWTCRDRDDYLPFPSQD